jgi:hypothetical protein
MIRTFAAFNHSHTHVFPLNTTAEADKVRAEVCQARTWPDERAAFSRSECNEAPVLHDDSNVCKIPDGDIMEAQEPQQENGDQSLFPVVSDRSDFLGCIPRNSILVEQIKDVVMDMKYTYTDKFDKVLQFQQKRTLRRDAFRVWDVFAVHMAAEKRLCNIVQTKKWHTVCREVFRAWRLGEKNQIEALETEIEALNERVRTLEEQKTRPLDIDYIARELGKRSLFVSKQSQSVQQTEAVQSKVAEQQPAAKTSSSWLPSLTWGRKSPITEQIGRAHV